MDFFNAGFDFSKDSVNLFPRVVLIVMRIPVSPSSKPMIHEITVIIEQICNN